MLVYKHKLTLSLDTLYYLLTSILSIFPHGIRKIVSEFPFLAFRGWQFNKTDIVSTVYFIVITTIILLKVYFIIIMFMFIVEVSISFIILG